MKKIISLILLLTFSGTTNIAIAQWSGVKKYDGPASMQGINLGIKLSKSDAKELKDYKQMSSDKLKEVFFQGEYDPYGHHDESEERFTYTPLKSVDMANGTLYFFQINNVEEEGFNGIIKVAKFIFNNKRFGYEVYAYEGDTPGASGVGQLESSIQVNKGKIIIKTSNSLTYPGLFTLDMPPEKSNKIPLSHTVITKKETSYVIESWVITEESTSETRLNRFPPNDLRDYLEEHNSIDAAVEVLNNLEYPLDQDIKYELVKSLYMHQKEIKPELGSRYAAVTKDQGSSLYRLPNNDILEDLPSGMILHVTDPNFLSGWYKVNYKGKEAYVKSSSVEYESIEVENKPTTDEPLLEQPVAFSLHPDGSVYILDYKTRQVFMYDENGAFKGTFAKGEIKGNPLDVEISADGKTYILTNDGCFIFNEDKKMIKKFGDYFSEPKLEAQRSMEISDQSLFILSLKQRIDQTIPGFYVFDLEGNYQRTIGKPYQGNISMDLGAFDDFDASYMTTMVRHISDGSIYGLGMTTDKIIDVGSKGLATGIAVDSKNDFAVYLALSRNGNEIAKYDKDGEYVGSFGSDILSSSLYELKILDDHLYVADFENNAVYRFSKAGELINSYK